MERGQESFQRLYLPLRRVRLYLGWRVLRLATLYRPTCAHYAAPMLMLNALTTKVTVWYASCADPPDKALLRQLGYESQEAAKEELKHIGRTGPLPWASLFFLKMLPYIKLTSFVLVPVAHLFLMGLMKTLLSYSLLNKCAHGSTVIFSEDQKKRVQVILLYPQHL